MHDSLGDRMKDIEGRTRYYLPRRCYAPIDFGYEVPLLSK